MNPGSMDPQVRNFRDFLQLYNKITEMCFSNCVDNFFARSISPSEGTCVDKCLNKFTQYNQRLMSVYIEVQTDINKRRAIEAEEKQSQLLTENIQNQTSDNIDKKPEILSTNQEQQKIEAAR